MDCVNSNTDIISSKQPNHKVGCTIIGTSADDRWNIFYNEDTGKQTYTPSDPDYFNKYCHEDTNHITYDICGCAIVKKIGQHKRTMKCRLANFILQDKLELEEDVTTT